jgi:hypothetical protein
MMLHIAMPSHRRGQKLAFSFDEDELTLAWDALRQANLGPGTRVAVSGIALPIWFLDGFRLTAAEGVDTVLSLVPTTVGPAVAVSAGPPGDLEAHASALHAKAPTRPEAEWQKHRLAREGQDAEGDYPLGAFVHATRHEVVTRGRMTLSPGKIISSTTIGPGAAPTEFVRLQDAVGAYHVVLVESANVRTVGLWAGEQAPQLGAPCQPVLRRLFRTQGTWRHGIKFEPA